MQIKDTPSARGWFFARLRIPSWNPWARGCFTLSVMPKGAVKQAGQPQGFTPIYSSAALSVEVHALAFLPIAQPCLPRREALAGLPLVDGLAHGEQGQKLSWRNQ